ncbi:MAG: radical SAM protein, partial [Selenomonadaceae bacterium]|nr:radical SAM protein [Selenomonadaceae bacterium]
MTDIDSILASCRLCPRQCQANRLVSAGRCGGGRLPSIALVSLHPWEEPVLTGTKGAGTVFFSGCSLGCVYCQNYEISHENQGLEVSIQRLGEIFWEQQQRGAAVLDLVTPTHYVPQIIQGLDLARQKGFSLPVVYNCSGYEKVETI